jgi:hypothetical protein
MSTIGAEQETVGYDKFELGAVTIEGEFLFPTYRRLLFVSSTGGCMEVHRF